MGIRTKNPIKNGLVKSSESKLRYEKKRLKKRIEELEKQLTLGGVVISVLCVDSKHSDNLRQGVEYELIAETEEYYGIINDLGILSGYCKWRFKKP